MANPVVHFEIAGLEEERTLNFYKSIFEWEIQSMPRGESTYNIVRTGKIDGYGIDGGIMKAPHGHPFSAFYIQVESLRATLDKITAAGGEEAVPPTPIPNMGAFAFFKDLDGNLIGLYRNGDGD
jgi:predicted enzyme related to lactoylglutathione lyase